MNRTSSSAYSSSSTAPTLTSSAPPTHNTTDPNGHAELLACFPEKLRVAIEATFPEYDELVAFHQDLVDKGLPLENESLVAFVLNKAREQKLIAQRRILFLPLRQNEEKGAEKMVSDTEPPLHEAILIWDGALVRELLRKGASPVEELWPRQRQKEFDAMVSVAARHESNREAEKKMFWFTEDDVDSEIEDGLAARLEVDIIEGLLETRDAGVRATVLAEHAGENALTLAISYEAPIEVIALLVEHCARHIPALLNQPDANGNLPLTLAAASGKLEVVNLLLQSGARIDIDRCNGKGHSALMEAARCGSTAIIKLLLEHGARADLPNAQGRTPRVLAAIREHTEAFDVLAEWEISLSGKAGAVNMGAKLVADLLDAAVRGNTSVLETIHAKLGQCIDAATLRKAVQQALWRALKKNNSADAIDWLIRHDADPNLADADEGLMPEEMACDRGNLEALMSIACPDEPQGFDPERRQTLLYEAARVGSMRFVVYALDGGADINRADPLTGKTALGLAVEREDRDMIKILLERGAHTCVGVAADDDEDAALNGVCPLALAAKADGSRESLVMFLVEHHPAPYSEAAQANLLLQLALKLQSPPLLERLIRDGRIDYDAYDDRPKSLLKVIARVGSGELMRVLLSPPAPVRRLLNAQNGNADAVLNSLAKSQDEDAVDVFDAILEACNISLYDDEDQLLDRLCLAVKVGSAASCKLILEKGKLRLQPDTPRDRNPLMLAVRCGNLDVIPLLLKHGASACAMARRTPESESRKSALHVAWERGSWKALSILMNHDPHLPEELGAILPSLFGLLEKSIMEAESVPTLPGDVFTCLLRHTEGMKVPIRALQALLFSAARSGNETAIAALLKRGADPQQEHPSGADALVLLLNGPNCSLECAGILLDALALAPGKTSEIWDTTIFGVPGYSPTREKTLLAALADPRIDTGRKIEIMCALILAKPPLLIEFSFPSMIESRARAYMEGLEPIAKRINASEPMNVLARVIQEAKKKAQESGEQWKADLISICKRIWDV